MRCWQKKSLVAAGLFLLALALRVPLPDFLYFNVHAARDMYRAYAMVHHGQFQWFGPELNFGGRTFGPAIYFILAIPQLFSSSPIATYFFVAVLGSLAPVWIFRAGLRFLPAWGAAVAGLLAAVNPTGIVTLRYLWNPVFLMPLCALMLLQTFRTRERPTALNFALLGAVAAVSVQVHLSTAIVVAVAVVSLIPGRRGVFLRRFPWAVGALFLFFLPGIIGSVVATQTFNPVGITPEVQREGWSRYAFNYNTPLVAMSLLSPDSHDAFMRSSFTHFDLFVLKLREGLAPGGRGLLWGMDGATGVAVLLFLLGAVAVVAGVPRGPRETCEGPDGFTDPVERALTLRIAFAWAVVPVLLLSFYNPLDWFRSGMPGLTALTNPPSYLAKRYLYQIWPGAFLVMAAGVVWLAGRGRWMRWPAWAAIGVLAGFQVLLLGLWLQTAARTGTMFMHGFPERAIPVYRDVARLARDLRDQGGLGKRDLTPERLHVGYEFGLFNMELELDYPLRRALYHAPTVGEIRDDESVVVLRREATPEYFTPRAVFNSGDYRVYVVPAPQGDRFEDEIAAKFIYPRNDWFRPYFAGEGKALMWAGEQ